jgi:hypothetical protein
MPARNLLKRVEALERKKTQSNESRLALLIGRAGQIALRTSEPLDTALLAAVRQIGTPLRISDVDWLLSPSASSV